MTWVRLDQDMAAHPKVAPLSDGAFRAFVYGLCYCNHYLTDGFIPERIAHTFVAAGAKGKRVAGELVEAGLWHAASGGYGVHDFLEYQPTKADVVALREKRAEAGRRGGQRSKHPTKHGSKPEANASVSEEAKQEAKRNPGSRTPKELSAIASSSDVRTDVRTVEQARPRSDVTKVWTAYQHHHPRAAFTDARRDLIRRRLKHYTADRLVDAIAGNHLDPHCNGENDRNQTYHDLELILRDAAHIERYEAIAHAAANGGAPTREQMDAVMARAAEKGWG